ncbi:MAG: hypothetical protein KDD34_06010, partial [Bdellovibrionales bacterium]|nr:hypothetical protein [Bdellovibrionales bacterium]
LPKTHYLCPDIHSFTEEKIQILKQQGYTHIKLKLGRDLDFETKQLKKHFNQLNSFQWRLDFNESLTVEAFQTWWHENKNILRPLLDYIEDPMPFDAAAWETLNAPIALDRGLDFENLKNFSGNCIVFKPANNILQWLSNLKHRVVFSNYMDHPLGEMTAIYAAQQYYEETTKEEVCGLKAWTLYEKNEFSEQLKDLGPKLFLAQGPGFGFGNLLEKQNWKVLK